MSGDIITERGRMSPSGRHWIGESGKRYPLTDDTTIDTRDRVPAYVEQLTPATREDLGLPVARLDPQIDGGDDLAPMRGVLLGCALGALVLAAAFAAGVWWGRA